MPVLKVDHIVSFSSEDPKHPASNILSSDNSKTWKCQHNGEKNAVVILQLEKASQISAIDIGNENSAYIEVSVSRSGSNEDFKVLLTASSFMTPIEARQNQNSNKVRMFTKDQFVKPQVDEKWDRVRIVCTQPFNKQCRYGLAFVNLINLTGGNEIPKAAPVQQNIGIFSLRPESPTDFSVGSLFAKRKELKQDDKLTGAAAIREASSSSSLALYGSPVCKPMLKNKNFTPKAKKENGDDEKTTPKDRNRNELLYDEDDEKPNEKIDRLIKKKADEVKGKEKEKAHDIAKKANVWDKKGVSPSISKNKDTPKRDLKRKLEQTTQKGKEKKMKKEKPSKPFEKLLEGVTLVISGIQNPDRANLRNKALVMGGKYKADWDSTCTHLICAFPNTPKFNQVKGKGKIVKRSWLEDCHQHRKRFPWRRYALDRDDKGAEESEEEILERVQVKFQDDKSDVDVKSDGTDVEFDEYKEEGSDTEERIAKLLEAQKNECASKIDDSVDAIYDADTDVEELF